MSGVNTLRNRLNKTGGEVDPEQELPIPGFVRVNLLPSSIAEKARVGQAKKIAGIAVGVAVVATGGLWFLAQLDAAAAQEDLTAAETKGAQLQGELAQLAEVPAIFEAAQTAEQALNTTMGEEVRWSFLLNQLSFSTPSGVTLENISGKTGSAAKAADAATDSAASALLPVVSPVGSMTFTGQADSFNKVAAWLDSLHVLQDYTYPFFSDASESSEGSFDSSVQFDSTAELTPKALSGRYGPTEQAETAKPDPGSSTPGSSSDTEGSGQ